MIKKTLHKLFNWCFWFHIPNKYLSEEFKEDIFAIGVNKIFVCEICGLIKRYHLSLGEANEKFIGYLDNYNKIIIAIKKIEQLKIEEKEEKERVEFNRAYNTHFKNDSLVNISKINRDLLKHVEPHSKYIIHL